MDNYFTHIPKFRNLKICLIVYYFFKMLIESLKKRYFLRLVDVKIKNLAMMYIKYM